MSLFRTFEPFGFFWKKVTILKVTILALEISFVNIFPTNYQSKSISSWWFESPRLFWQICCLSILHHFPHKIGVNMNKYIWKYHLNLEKQTQVSCLTPVVLNAPRGSMPHTFFWRRGKTFLQEFVWRMPAKSSNILKTCVFWKTCPPKNIPI